MPETIDFDVDTLTLGEMAAVEEASGRDFSELWKRSASKMLAVVFVQRLRTSGQAPNWHELGSLRVLDVSFSTSDSSPDNPSPKSQD